MQWAADNIMLSPLGEPELSEREIADEIERMTEDLSICESWCENVPDPDALHRLLTTNRTDHDALRKAVDAVAASFGAWIEAYMGNEVQKRAWARRED